MTGAYGMQVPDLSSGSITSKKAFRRNGSLTACIMHISSLLN